MSFDRTPTRHVTTVRIATAVFLLSLGGTFAVNVAAVAGIVRESTNASVHHDLEAFEGSIAATVQRADRLAGSVAADQLLRGSLSRWDLIGASEHLAPTAARLQAEHGISEIHLVSAAGESLQRHTRSDTRTSTSAPPPTLAPQLAASGRSVATLWRGAHGLEARAAAPITDPDAPGTWLAAVEVAIPLDEAFLHRSLPGHSAALLATDPDDDAVPAEAPAGSSAPLGLVASNLTGELDLTRLVGTPASELDDVLAELEHDRRRWSLATEPLHDMDGVQIGALLVASDISALSRHVTFAWWNAGVAVVLTAGVGMTLVLTRRARDRQVTETQRTIGFDARLGRALQHAERETEVLTIIDEALEEIAPDRPTRVLVADSSRAHLAVALSRHLPPVEGTLPTPFTCPATRTGETQHFRDSRALDACPALKRGACAPPDSGPIQARCQPLSIQGSTIGVLQTLKDVGEDDEHLRQRLDVLVRRSGDRISVLRALSETRRQASTDPLTGLHNRRSFDQEVARQLHTEERYAVLFADLDHFKNLNDTHGHEVGDRALRVFSEVVQTATRPSDVAGRWGGEEFVIFLSRCDRSAARDAAERIRAGLSERLAGGQVPHFTVSIGVADSEHAAAPFTAEGLDTVVSAADGALLRAKAAGRDRVVISGEPDPPAPDGHLADPGRTDRSRLAASAADRPAGHADDA